MRFNTEHLTFCIFVVMPCWLTAYKVEFFEYPQYKGFLFQTYLTEECINLPMINGHEYRDKIRSLRTRACMMAYNEKNCHGSSIQILSDNNNDLLMTWDQTMSIPRSIKTSYKEKAEFFIESFHLCTENAGKKLAVELTEYNPVTTETKPAKVFESYVDVCSCRNIPSYVQDMDKWSIHNYGNSLKAFFDQDCLTTPVDSVWIPGGTNSYSIGLGSFQYQNEANDKVHTIKSFGPDPNANYFRNHCLKLYATILKFAIIDTPKSSDPLSSQLEQDIEMTASKTVFLNNGPGQLRQSYSASETIRESFQMDLGTSLSKMNSVQIDTAFNVENKLGGSNLNSHFSTSTEEKGGSVSAGGIIKGVGLSASGSWSKTSGTEHSSTSTIFNEKSLKHGIRNAYENSGSKDKTSNNITTVEAFTSFKVDQMIIIEPCTEIVVNAYIKKVKSKLIEYQALLSIRGKLGDKQMMADELRNNLDNQLIYIEDQDPLTILVYYKSQFTAEYGISSHVNTEGSTIQKCVVENLVDKCPLCEPCSAE